MRAIAFKIGFASALALLAPLSALCASHTSKAAAHTVRPAAHQAASHPAKVRGTHGAHAEPRAAVHADGRAERTLEAANHVAKGKHGREEVVEVRGRKGRMAESARDRKPARPLTKAQKRAQAAEEARDAREERQSAAAHKGSKLALATNRHPLREEPAARTAGSRLAASAQPRSTAAAPARVASLNDSDALPERTEQPAALPPVNVHHDRKVHYTPGGESDDANTALAPVTRPATPSRNTARPSSPPQPQSGVSHPDEMDEQGPMSSAYPAPAPIAQAAPVPTSQSRLQPVYGIGRQAVAQVLHAAIGTPLVMAPTSAPPTSAVMTSRQAMPPPASEPQVQPSAALRARLPSIEDEAAQTQLVPSLLYSHGQLVMPPALKGSREILVHQNTEANREGLVRIRDDDDLIRMRGQKLLVALPEVSGLAVDDRLPANRRFARPWTARFLADLARAHYAHFHTDLIVTSAVRTVEVQQRLMRTNGNAAPAEGETASPHLTGQAVDLGKKGLSMTEIAWMRGYLLPLVQQGKVDVEEEFQQACFHISVYRGYIPGAPGAAPVIGTHRSAASSLATALPAR